MQISDARPDLVGIRSSSLPLRPVQIRRIHADPPAVSYYNFLAQIHPAARKHGIADEDIEHAAEHAMTIEDQDDTRLPWPGTKRRRTAGDRHDQAGRRVRAGDPCDANESEVSAAVAREAEYG